MEISKMSSDGETRMGLSRPVMAGKRGWIIGQYRPVLGVLAILLLLSTANQVHLLPSR